MGLLLWPVAILVFLAWSLAAWIVYSLSDWLAGLLANAASGILSADLGPWAQWLLNSLGDIIQIGVIVLWGIVSVMILWSPVWLRRRRNQSFLAGAPDYSRQRNQPAAPAYEPVPRYEPLPTQPAGRPWRGDEWRHGGWRDRDAWRDRFSQGRRDLDELRYMAREYADRYRSKKKWKKKYRDDDDD